MGKHRNPREPRGEPNYAVGYGRPPENTRFKKGESGNSKGRPPKRRSLHAELEEELSRPIEVRERGRVRKVTKLRAMATNLVNKAVMGDQKACVIVLNQIGKAGVVATGQSDAPFTDNDQAILADFLRRTGAEQELAAGSQADAAAEATAQPDAASGDSKGSAA